MFQVRKEEINIKIEESFNTAGYPFTVAFEHIYINIYLNHSITFGTASNTASTPQKTDDTRDAFRAALHGWWKKNSFL